MKKINNLIFLLLLIFQVSSVQVLKAQGCLVNAGNDTTICPGGSAQLNGTMAGALFFSWSPSTGLTDTTIANPVASPSVTTTYYLTGAAPSGELIVNGDFSAGNTGFTSSYNYCNAANCLFPEGYYAVGNNPNFFHSGFVACTDHTGGNGNMMIINGATVANVVIWSETITVTPNTNYAFSTWLASVNSTNPAILQFSINGVLLGAPFNGISTTCVWNQFYTLWNSGANTSITISIVNQNTIANGNDFILDDISFAPLCNSTDSVTVTVSQLPAATASGYPVCTGQNLALFSGGGSSYSWSGPNSFTSTLQNPVITSATTAASGIYTVTVTNGIGCSDTAQATVFINPPIIASIAGTDVLCFGNSTGAATLTVSGGTPGYIYIWNNGASTQDLINIPAGTYSVTVVDQPGCTTSASVVIANSSPAMVLSITGSNVICYGAATGSADLTVTGGTSPYTFNWNNGAFTTQNLVNIPAGTYSVVVSDFNNCQATASITITQVAQSLSGTISATNVACYGDANGAANLTVIGGVSPYLYLWSNGATTEDLANLVVGTYCVTITDAAGCSTSVCTTITQAAAPLSAYITGTNLTCYNVCTGLGVCHASGGTPGFGGYTYLWSIGGIVNDSLIGACAGNYTCTVTDGSGCTTAASVILTQPQQPASLNLSPIHILCYGNCTGEVDLTYSDIYPTNSYLWSNGDTTQDIVNLCAGYYSVTVTDSAGCFRVGNTNVNQPLMPLHDTIAVTNVSCYFGSNGNINLTALGGTAPYTYQWLPHYQTTPDISNIFLGTDSLVYKVTITDANGCTKTDSVTIHQPHAPLTATITGTNIKCNGASTGAINLTPTGGTQGNGYQFLWNTGAITQNLSNLPAGTYQVTITDVHGCDTVYFDTLTQPTAIILALTPSNTWCTYNCFGGIKATVAGGVPSPVHGYTFNWSNGLTSHDDTLLCVGTYTLTVTDSLGCTYIDSATVNSNSHITANGSANPVTGNSPVDVQFTFTGSGATSFNWDFGDGSSSTVPNPEHTFITPVSAPGVPITYNVILIDHDSLCSDTFQVSIEVNPSSSLIVPNVFTPNGDGHNDMFKVQGVAIATFNCQVFNRWGKKVFEWNDVNQGWDGNIGGGKASDGVYYYILKAHGMDGKDFNMHGSVTLIR